MTIFGKPASSYVSFALPAVALVVLVGLIRLAMSLAGMPFSTTKWVSMNGAVLIAMVFVVLRMRSTGFGRYRHLLPTFVLVSVGFHLVAIAGIVIGIVTGQDNVYTVPEAAFGQDGKTWSHVMGHVMVGIPAVSLINWGLGSLLLLILGKGQGQGDGESR